jgi:peroxiredoxin
MIKKVLILIVLAGYWTFPGYSQSPIPGSSMDKEAIRQAALDYAEGLYGGDPVKIAKVVHPDFNKVILRKLEQSGRIALRYNTYSQIIENARVKVGFLDENKRNIEVTLIDLQDDMACVKINSTSFIDFLELARLDGQWKILNILENEPSRLSSTSSGFLPEGEKEAIHLALENYVVGTIAGDAKRLEIALDPDFNKVGFGAADTGQRAVVRRQRLLTSLELALAGRGKLDESKRNFRIRILDIDGDMATAQVYYSVIYEYLELYKTSGSWKILNGIAQMDAHRRIADALPVLINEPMPDFTLPIHGGGEYNLAKHRGKNVMLIFPRGYNGVNNWCPYCQYQYMDLVELEKKYGLRKKYNMEIVWVLPYDGDHITDWFRRFPESTTFLEAIRNTPQPWTPFQKERVEFFASHFPKKFNVKGGDVPELFPVLVDADRTVSRRFKLFTNFWDEVTIDQNIPTVYILDKAGIVRLKYQSQTTIDRPSFDYLFDFIKKML